MKRENVKYDGISKFDGSMKFRDIITDVVLYLKSYEVGEMYFKPMCGRSIENFASIIFRCFNKDSDLKGIKRMTFEFNGVIISVTEDTAKVETITKEYNKIYNSFEKLIAN